MTSKQTDPVVRSALALVCIIGLAAWLRLWHLDANGYGREYYAAGVRSMLGSLHAFLYNAFDPLAFVSIDKPPVALWMQVLTAKVLGFSAFSLMLTQVLEGLVAILLVYKIVSRHFGATAGRVAALCLALTPISVAVDRSNNTESCLTMVLLIAVWALIRATETTRLHWLLLAFGLVGIGFNVKMAAALILAPTICLTYFLSATGVPIRQRLTQLVQGGVLMAAVALSWVAFFDLTPASDRPYAGSTRGNSMFELTVVHNGLHRFLPSTARDSSSLPSATETSLEVGVERTHPEPVPSHPTPQVRKARWDNTPTGALRLATPFHAAQVDWWLPFVLAGLLLSINRFRIGTLTKGKQTQLMVWAGWALSYGIVFSFAGGVFHTYYLGVLGAPLAALAGIGWASLLERKYETGGYRDLALVLGLTGIWQLYIEYEHLNWALNAWHGLLFMGAILLIGAASTLLWLLPASLKINQFAPLIAASGLLGSILLPAAWALSVVMVRPNVAAPVANISVLIHPKPPNDLAASYRQQARGRYRKLVGFLRSNHEAELYFVAVPNAMQAAPLILHSGLSVMTMGGYLGRDPILKPEEFDQKVQAGEVRFVMLGGPSIVTPDSAAEKRMAAWIRAHGTLVARERWGGASVGESNNRATGPRKRELSQLFDLRPAK